MLKFMIKAQNNVINPSHIKEHLSDKIDVGNLTPDQQRFYYFSISDLDKDNRIDGTEIIKALAHDHTQGAVAVPRSLTQSDDELVTMVDGVLKDMDLNGDGYIDYAEYVTTQNL
uniref:EF-hand domain-containing protein n=1 Tax=Angiostrongylus cantonensis TaxID=6313 RepID=A0A0K0CT01_ANGCA